LGSSKLWKARTEEPKKEYKKPNPAGQRRNTKIEKYKGPPIIWKAFAFFSLEFIFLSFLYFFLYLFFGSWHLGSWFFYRYANSCKNFTT